MRLNIYLPDDLAEAVRAAMSGPDPINVSQVCQAALRRRVAEEKARAAGGSEEAGASLARGGPRLNG